MFDYKKAKLEKVFCNLCGKDNFFVLAQKSENNLPVRTCICRNCGLIYINPRMTKNEYDNYYKYFYRKNRGEIKNRKEFSFEDGFLNARRFGHALAKRLRAFIRPGLTVDIGSSTGGILYGLGEKISGLELFGVEPSVAESDFANSRGIKTERALFEDFAAKPFRPMGNVLCIQTFNHLLDPRRFLDWVFKNLEPGGHLILAVKNFRHKVRQAGFIESAVQIDHPYMFTPETLKLFVESSGFKVRYMDVDEYKHTDELWAQKSEGMHRGHIRLIGEKPPEDAKAILPSEISRPDIYRKIRFQLARPYVKFCYLFFYSYRLKAIRKFFRI